MSDNPSDYPSEGPEQPPGPPTGYGPGAGQQAAPGFATPPRPSGNPGPGAGPHGPGPDPFGPGPGAGPHSAGPHGPDVGPPPPVARQLVRDPYTKLGGVSSGLSHHYGVDVSLVRLAFVLFTIISGFGIIFYALAWLIIPRAQFWPPVGGRPSSKPLSSREIGIGLLLLGALVALFINGGTFSQVLTPIVLIAGGFWLLTQSPTPDHVPAAPVAPEPPVDPVQPMTGAVPLGAPVPRRSGRRKFAVIGFIGAIIVLPVLFVSAAIAALVFGEVDFEADPGASYVFAPATVDAIPETIRRDEGSILLDLSQIDTTTFDEPIEIEIDLDFGEIDVIVPEDMEIEVDAEAGLGAVSVFDRESDGIKPSIVQTANDPDVIFDIRLGVGDVSVDRGTP